MIKGLTIGYCLALSIFFLAFPIDKLSNILVSMSLRVQSSIDNRQSSMVLPYGKLSFPLES